MCNQIMPPHFEGRVINAEPIPEKGVGWKIFRTTKKEIIGLCCHEYERDLYGWIKYKDPPYKLRHEVAGFCFFKTEELAQKALLEIFNDKLVKKGTWHWVTPDTTVVKQIKYRDGLVERNEYRFTRKVQRIRLCREFQICKENQS